MWFVGGLGTVGGQGWGSHGVGRAAGDRPYKGIYLLPQKGGVQTIYKKTGHANFFACAQSLGVRFIGRR